MGGGGYPFKHPHLDTLRNVQIIAHQPLTLPLEATAHRVHNTGAHGERECGLAHLHVPRRAAHWDKRTGEAR